MSYASPERRGDATVLGYRRRPATERARDRYRPPTLAAAQPLTYQPATIERLG